MAGPVLNVLVALDGPAPTWRDCLVAHAVDWDGETSCWVNADRQFDGEDPSRPFVVSVSRILKCGDYEEIELTAFERTLELPRFTHAICLAAMCNRVIDHWLLCTLAATIADERGGVIDFDSLNAPYFELGMKKCCWDGDDPINWTIIGDAKSAKNWLAHPEFHLVK